MERLRGVPGLNVSDFGTRRRHSFLWQEYVVNAMRDVLGDSFAGTSNTFLAYKHDLEAIGTNAHELPMAMAALADNDDEIAHRAVPLARALAADLPGRAADPPARHLRHHAVPAQTRPTGSPTGPASASTARTPSSPATNTSPGSSAAAAIRARSASSLPTHSTSSHPRPARLLRRPSSQRRQSPCELSLAPAIFSTPRRWTPDRRIRFSAGWGTLLTNDFRNCNPQGNESISIPSAWSANSAKSMAAPPSSSRTTTPKPWALPKKSSATAKSSARKA